MPSKAEQPIELEYQVKDTKLADFIQAVNEEWDDVLENDASVGTALGLRPGEAPPEKLLRAPYDVTRKGGSVLAGATILVAATGVGVKIANRVLLDLWQRILLPRLEHRFGIKPKGGAARSRVGSERKKKSSGATSGKRKTAGRGKKKVA
jgi:hypothetical protein